MAATGTKKRAAPTQATVRRILYIICVIIAVGVTLYNRNHTVVQTVQPVDGEMQIYFIDVVQADCELIVCGDHSVLVDGGEAATAADVLKRINDLGIKKLDCIVATHPHADHIGGLPYILDNIEVGEVLMPKLTKKNIPTTRTYEKFLTSLANNGAKAVRATPGDTHVYGDIRFQILSPVFEQTEGLNNMSIVFRMEYGETSFLFTGDAEKQVERELVSTGSTLKCDVLKVGHHGSATSSTEEFISAVAPRYAFIECGDGTPSHPHRQTLDRLAAVGAQVYRTDLNGTIILTTDGKNITVTTEK